MAEITVDVGVRLNVIQSSIAELERAVNKSLNPDSSGFKAMQKILTSMRTEAERLQIQMNKGFGSQQQFNQAGKTIEKLETSLARAKIAAENIKFSDIKLNSSQQKMFSDIEQQIAKADAEFTEFQNKVRDGIVQKDSNKSALTLAGLKPSDYAKSFDEVSALIDKGVARIEQQYADANKKLTSAYLKATPDQRLANEVANKGISKDTFSSYDNWFRDNGQLMNESSRENMLKAFVGQFEIDDATKSQIVNSLKDQSLDAINEAFKTIKNLTGDELKNSPLKILAEQAQQYAKDVNPHMSAVQELESQLQIVHQLQAEMQAATAEGGAMTPGIEKYNQQINEYADALQRLREQITGATKDQLGLSGSLSPMESELHKFTQQLNAANTEFLRLQQQQQTFNSMKMAITNFMGFNQVLNLTKRAVKDAMNHIKQLDTTMNGISIVTDMTTGDLWKQVDTYSAMAQKYGTTIQGAYDVSKIYYQQGLETADVLALTEETLKLSKVSGLDYATTTDYMTTALRGFKMEMSEASTVVDVYSNLAANTAVSQEELAVAMSKTASSMESVGSTFQDTSAMIATMVAVTRESATNIGSAMKSIASRYGELTKDPQKLLDSEGEVMSFNKVDAALKSVGISMQTTDHQFRDFTDVIVELSEKWDTLDSTQQRYIATQFAGNRQQSRFLALVSNGDLLKENMETAENSEDIGTLQALKALDSIESKMNQVQVAAQQFYTTIGAEGLWKSALDGITNYINGLNNLPKLFGKIPLGAIAMVANLIDGIKSLLFKAVATLAKAWKDIMEPSTIVSNNGGQQAIQNTQGIIDNIANTIKQGKANVVAAWQDLFNVPIKGKTNTDATPSSNQSETNVVSSNIAAQESQIQAKQTQAVAQGVQERISLSQEEIAARQANYAEMQSAMADPSTNAINNFSNAFNAEVERIKGNLSNTEIPINVRTEQALSDIQQLKQQLEQGKEENIIIGADVSNAENAIKGLESEIKNLSKEEQVKINAEEVNKIRERIKELMEQLKQLTSGDNKINFTIENVDKIKKELEELQSRLEQINLKGLGHTKGYGGKEGLKSNLAQAKTEVSEGLAATETARSSALPTSLAEADNIANQLKAKMQELSNIPMNSPRLLKQGLEEATQLTEQLKAKIAEAEQAGGSGEHIAELKRQLAEATQQAQGFQAALNKSSMNTANTLGNIATALNMISALFNNGSRGGQMMAGAIQSIAGALMLAKAAQLAFNTAANTNPYLALASGILFVVNGISTMIEDAEERAERLSKTAEEASNKAKEKNADYKLLDRSINKLQELEKARYDSAEAAEEYQTAVDELADKYPQLITGLDAVGNATIEAANLDYELEKARRAAAEATLAAAKAEREKAENDLKDAKDALITKQNEFNGDSLSRRDSSIDTSPGSLDFMLPYFEEFYNFLGEDLSSTQSILKTLYNTDNLKIGINFDEYNNMYSLSNIEDNLNTFKDNLKDYYGVADSDIESLVDILQNSLNNLSTNDNYSFSSDDIKAYSNKIKGLEKLDKQSEEFLTAVKNLSQEISTAGMQGIFSSFITYAGELETGLASINDYEDMLKSTEKTELSAAINTYGKEQQVFVENLGEGNGILTSWLYRQAETYKKDHDGTTTEDYINKQLKSDYDEFAENYKNLDYNVQEKFQEMWKNRKQYTADDIIKEIGLETDPENPVAKAIREYYKDNNMNPAHYAVQLQKKITSKWGGELNDQGLRDFSLGDKAEENAPIREGLSKLYNSIRDAQNYITTEFSGWIASQIDVIDEYASKGYYNNANKIALATAGIINQVGEIANSRDQQKLRTLIKSNNLSTREGIEKLTKEMEETGLGQYTGMFEPLKDALIYNLPLAIQSYVDNIVSSAEDFEKVINSAENGLSFSDAAKALEKLNSKRKTGEQPYQLSDVFDEENGKFTFKNKEARQSYVDSQLEDAEHNLAILQQEREKADGIISGSADRLMAGQKFVSTGNEELRALLDSYGLIENLYEDKENPQKITGFVIKNAEQIQELLGTEDIPGWLQAKLDSDLKTAEELAQYEEKTLPARLALAAGDYKGYFEELNVKYNEIDLRKVAKGESIGGLDYKQIKPAMEKINSEMNNFTNDIMEKGIENVHLEDYDLDGIFVQPNLDYWKNAIDSGEKGYADFVRTYGDYLGGTVEQQNAMMVQAIEKDAQKTQGAEDALKNVNFLRENLAYASLDTIQQLADSLGVAVEDLFDPNSYDAALDGYKLNMEVLTANGLDEIVNSSNIVADSVKSFLDTLAEGIGKGLEGKLDYAGRDNLISNLSKFGIELEKTDFTRTADGLKLNQQRAIELYNTLKQIDSISAKFTFDALAKSLESTDENYTNISTIAKRIADLQREIDNPDVSTARRQEYEAELAVAEEIYRVRSSTDNKDFNFMSRNLPNGMQNPIDYWDATGKAYKSMNQAAKSGYMEIADFYNIVNEMNNMAAASGQTLSFMGQTLSGKAEDAAALIEAGMSALKNVDGEGVKIALGSLGVDFATGAADMSGNFDTGVKAMAKSQIKMLDAAINMLEAIVAMEELDVEGDGLDIGNIFSGTFDDNGLPEFTTKAEKWFADVENLCGGIKIGELNLKEAVQELGKEDPQKAVDFLKNIMSIDWTLGDMDVVGQIQNVVSAFFPGKIVSQGTSIFDVLQVPKDLDPEKDTDKIKKWADNMKISVEDANKLIDQMHNGSLKAEKGTSLYDSVEKLLGLDGKDKKIKAKKDLFEKFAGETITGDTIERWENIGFKFDEKGNIESGIYHGTDGGSITLDKNNPESWAQQIDQYETALAKARDLGGSVVKAVEGSNNSEFTFNTSLGVKTIITMVDSKGGVTYKFPNGFECEANTPYEAAGKYVQYLRENTSGHMGEMFQSMSDEEILIHQGYLLKQATDVTFDTSDPENNPAEKIKEATTEQLEQALNGKHGTFNPETKQYDWNIELPSGEHIEFSTNGQEIDANTLKKKALESLGIDSTLVDGIAQGIQEAFTQANLGETISGTIIEGIRDGFTNVNLDSEGNELPPVTVDMSGKIDANTDIQPRRARVSGCGIMTSAESEERAWELWLSMYQAQITNNTTTETLTTTGTHTIEATTTSSINYTLNIDGDNGIITYVWSDGTTLEDQSKIESKVQEYFNQNATITTVDGGQGSSINAVRTINGVTYLITIQKNATDGKYLIQGFGSAGLVDNPSDWINEQISKKMDEGTAGISNQETTSLPSISRTVSINGVDYTISIEKIENGMYKVNFPGWGEVSTTDPDTWINNCVTAELEKGTTGINSDASITKDPLKGTISYNGINYDITVGENKKYLVNGAGDYTSLNEAVQNIMGNISSTEGTASTSINGGTTTITQEANVVVDAQDVSLSHELTLPSIPTLTQEVNELIIKPKNVKIDNGNNESVEDPLAGKDWRPSWQKGYDNNYNNVGQNSNNQSSLSLDISTIEAPSAAIEAANATVNANNGTITGSVTHSGPIQLTMGGSTSGGEGGEGKGSGSSASSENGAAAASVSTAAMTSEIQNAQGEIDSFNVSAISTGLAEAEGASTSFQAAMSATMSSVPDEKKVNVDVEDVTAKVKVDISVNAQVNVSGAEVKGTPKETVKPPDIKGGNIKAGGSAKGNVALARGKGTLMGELGPELIVSGGRYYTVGDDGAEFVDLPDDAIVFNHKQTKRLLGNKGAISGRGKPVKSEAAALSFATGNVSGPALASAAAALAALKQIRAMWQSMLDASAKDLGSQAGRGGGGGGGGGGGDDAEQPTTTTDDIQRWYNWLRQIDKIEQDISYQEKLQTKYENDRIANGQKIYKAQKQQYDLLGEEIKRNEKLAALQKSWYDNKRAELAASSYGKIFTYDENGLQQYTGNDRPGSGVGLDILENLTRRNVNGQAIDNAATAKKQLAYLQSVGFNLSDLLYNDDGTKVAKSIDKNLKLKKINKKDKDNDLYTQMMENFWNNVDAWRDELDSLYDSYHEQQEKIIENQNKQNEILQAFVENELDVEQQLLEAIESREQALIDKLQDQKEALEKSNDKFIKGLTDQLNKEKEMRQNNERDSDLVKLQRQLAILQRSGGSASQIKSLQDQIASQQQDMYYEERQQQIDAIQEASDKQLERLDTQISIMTETLDYQKENGLLWNEVREIMETNTSEEAAQKILEWNNEYTSKSALDVQESIREFQEAFQQWAERRDDENDPLQDTSISRSDAIEDIEAGNKEFSALSGESKSKIQSAARNAGQKAYDEAIANGGTEEEAEKAYRQAYSNTISDADTLQKYKNIESHGAAAEGVWDNIVENAKNDPNSFVNNPNYAQYGDELQDRFIENLANSNALEYDESGKIISDNATLTQEAQKALQSASEGIKTDNLLKENIPLPSTAYGYTFNEGNSKQKTKDKKRYTKLVSQGLFGESYPVHFTGNIVSKNLSSNNTNKGKVVKNVPFLEAEVNGKTVYFRSSDLPGIQELITGKNTATAFDTAADNTKVNVNDLKAVPLTLGAMTPVSIRDTNGSTYTLQSGVPVGISYVSFAKSGNKIYDVASATISEIAGKVLDKEITLTGGQLGGTNNAALLSTFATKATKKSGKKTVAQTVKVNKKNRQVWIPRPNYKAYYKQGGMADFTGPAWLDGTKTKPEAVLNAAQTDFLKHDLLGNKRNSLASIVTQLQDIFDNTIAGATSSTSSDESITIEKVSINFNAGTISSDYDARRAGELVKEEMLKIARKTGNRSVSRR